MTARSFRKIVFLLTLVISFSVEPLKASDHMPEELWSLSYSFMGFKDRARGMLVCKSFYEILKTDQVLLCSFANESHRNVNSFLDRYEVYDFLDLIQKTQTPPALYPRLEAYVQNVQKYQKNLFSENPIPEGETVESVNPIPEGETVESVLKIFPKVRRVGTVLRALREHSSEDTQNPYEAPFQNLLKNYKSLLKVIQKAEIGVEEKLNKLFQGNKLLTVLSKDGRYISGLYSESLPFFMFSGKYTFLKEGTEKEAWYKAIDPKKNRRTLNMFLVKAYEQGAAEGAFLGNLDSEKQKNRNAAVDEFFQETTDPLSRDEKLSFLASGVFVRNPERGGGILKEFLEFDNLNADRKMHVAAQLLTLGKEEEKALQLLEEVDQKNLDELQGIIRDIPGERRKEILVRINENAGLYPRVSKLLKKLSK